MQQQLDYIDADITREADDLNVSDPGTGTLTVSENVIDAYFNLDAFISFGQQFGYRIEKANQIQREFIDWYFKSSADCVVRSGTGSGKTSLGMLMTKYSKRVVNIVLLPFLGLVDSFIASCKKYQVDAHRYSPESHQLNFENDFDGVMVVCCYEEYEKESFNLWVHQLQKDRLLGKVFIDECHILLEEIDFRPAVSIIKRDTLN
jgi:hypothetical protein